MNFFKRAFELADQGDRPGSRNYTGHSNYEIALAGAAESVVSDNPDLSVKRVEEQIDQAITETVEEEGDINKFLSRKSEFIGNLFNEDVNVYTITFYVNVTTDSAQFPSTITFRNLEMTQLTPSDAIDALEEAGYSSEGATQDSEINRFFEDNSQIDPENPSEFSPHQVSISARNHKAAVKKFKNWLFDILGMVNYVRHSASESRLPDSEGLGNGFRSAVTALPFIVIEPVREGGEFVRISMATPPQARMESGVRSKLKEMPSFETKKPLDDGIIPSFRAYQEALMSSDKESSFIALCRGLESATFTSQDSNSDTAPLRAVPFTETTNPDLYESWIKTHLKEKRNSQAHDVRRREILTRDVRLLEYLLQSTIQALLKLREEGYGARVSKIMREEIDDKETLQSELESLRTKAERIEMMIAWTVS